MKGEKLVEPCLSLPPSLRSPSSLLTRASPPRPLHSRTTFAYPWPFPGGGDYKLTPFSILPPLQIDSFLRSPHLPGSLWPLKGYRKKLPALGPLGRFQSEAGKEMTRNFGSEIKIGNYIADGSKTLKASSLSRSYPRFFLRYTTKATRGRATERRPRCGLIISPH